MPDINEEQRTRAGQIMKDVKSVTNMETSYAENDIDPNIMEGITSNYEQLNKEQKSFCDNALEVMLGDTDEQFFIKFGCCCRN